MANIQQTTLESWKKLTENRQKLAEKQEKVLQILKNSQKSLTNCEISRVLGWDINRVTPRVLELRKLGLVVKDKIRRCNITNNNANSWIYVCVGVVS